MTYSCTIQIRKVERLIEYFLASHMVGTARSTFDKQPLAGDFSLRCNGQVADLYGMIDAVYILHTIGRLPERTDRSSRTQWARAIMSCQDHDGWFSLRNERGHSREHATAYAIGALHLLAIELDEDYVSQIKPLAAILPMLTDRLTCEKWLGALDFRFTPHSILEKKLGWHYIWRGSHVGGGIPAAIGMSKHLIQQWWPGQVNIDRWFGWYFDWLDSRINPRTGYWQRAFWNAVYRKPTIIDMGGAVHFYWIYDALKRPFPYPEAVIESTLSLQRADGLYKDHPFCIDLDANFCLIRSFLQLPSDRQDIHRERIYRAAERNFEAIILALTEQPLEQIYSDSHGLPGALAALVECTKLPDFRYADILSDWRHPLDKVWWL